MNLFLEMTDVLAHIVNLSVGLIQLLRNLVLLVLQLLFALLQFIFLLLMIVYRHFAGPNVILQRVILVLQLMKLQFYV